MDVTAVMNVVHQRARRDCGKRLTPLLTPALWLIARRLQVEEMSYMDDDSCEDAGWEGVNLI